MKIACPINAWLQCAQKNTNGKSKNACKNHKNKKKGGRGKKTTPSVAGTLIAVALGATLGKPGARKRGTKWVNFWARRWITEVRSAHFNRFSKSTTGQNLTTETTTTPARSLGRWESPKRQTSVENFHHTQQPRRTFLHFI